jgi:hypothetical protein
MKATMFSVRRLPRRDLRPTLERCEDRISLSVAFDIPHVGVAASLVGTAHPSASQAAQSPRPYEDPNL